MIPVTYIAIAIPTEKIDRIEQEFGDHAVWAQAVIDDELKMMEEADASLTSDFNPKNTED